MKKLSYVLGLVAMVVMMTMTSCGGVSSEVQKYCDTLDDITQSIADAESAEEVAQIAVNNDFNTTLFETETKLTEEDKKALKESVMNWANTLNDKVSELGGVELFDDDYLNQYENQLDAALARSETLGEFDKNFPDLFSGSLY